MYENIRVPPPPTPFGLRSPPSVSTLTYPLSIDCADVSHDQNGSAQLQRLARDYKT